MNAPDRTILLAPDEPDDDFDEDDFDEDPEDDEDSEDSEDDEDDEEEETWQVGGGPATAVFSLTSPGERA